MYVSSTYTIYTYRDAGLLPHPRRRGGAEPRELIVAYSK